MGEGAWLIALDALSGALLALVAVRFARLARAKSDALSLLFAAGVALLALSYPTVSASHLDLGGRADVWSGLRIAGQTGGALVVLAAYATARLFGRARPALALGWALVALALGAAALVLAPPAGSLPPMLELLIIAHAVMAVAWALASALAGGRARGLNVPVAFASFAVGKLAWLAVDLGGDAALLGVVYVARFAGIALLLDASRPLAAPAGGAHAAA